MSFHARIDFFSLSRSPPSSLSRLSLLAFNSTASFLAERAGTRLERDELSSLRSPFCSLFFVKREKSSTSRAFSRERVEPRRSWPFAGGGQSLASFFFFSLEVSLSLSRAAAWALENSPLFPSALAKKTKTCSPLSPLDRIRVRAQRGVGRGRGCSDGEDAPGSRGRRGRRGNRGKQERRRRRLRAIPRGAQPALRRARGPRQGAGASGRGRSRAEHGETGRAGGERARGGGREAKSRETEGDGK